MEKLDRAARGRDFALARALFQQIESEYPDLATEILAHLGAPGAEEISAA